MCLPAGVNPEAEAIIKSLGLRPLPREGGWFAPTWVSTGKMADGRAAGSLICYLMTGEGFSALHRLHADEIWQFTAGDAVEHLQLDPRDGRTRVVMLGPDVLAGQQPQLVVPPGVWQGARLAAGAHRGWALLGCTMVPAWDEREFELGERAALQREFPGEAGRISALTR